jgi:hypothetical protein
MNRRASTPAIETLRVSVLRRAVMIAYPQRHARRARSSSLTRVSPD